MVGRRQKELERIKVNATSGTLFPQVNLRQVSRQNLARFFGILQGILICPENRLETKGMLCSLGIGREGADTCPHPCENLLRVFLKDTSLGFSLWVRTPN